MGVCESLQAEQSNKECNGQQDEQHVSLETCEEARAETYSEDDVKALQEEVCDVNIGLLDLTTA